MLEKIKCDGVIVDLLAIKVLRDNAEALFSRRSNE